jgi:hypothetical protein
MGARTTTKSKPKDPGIQLDQVEYYFDAVDRDRLEAAGTSRKSGEVLALRERLLKLPDGQFEAAMKTVRALVEEAARNDGREGPEETGVRRRAARTLYDGVAASKGRGNAGSSTGKVSPA